LGPGGGGVFHSTDAGHTWRAAGLAGEEVRALAQAPGHPEILIAGTLTGVYRSTNAGERWERISPANHEDLHNFDSLAIDPANPQIIYAGTYHLPWKTTDGGRNWVPIHTGMVDDSDVMSIGVDHTDPSRLYASACSGIYRGEDGGARWTKFRGIPNTARRTHLILQDPARPQTIYAVTTQGLWKTLDGGAVWTRMTSASWSIITLLIHPKNPDRLVMGVEGQGIYVSDDGAKTFRAANSGFNHRQVMDLASDREHPGRMLVVLANSAEPVVATHDGGLTWSTLGPGLQTHMVRHVYAAPDGRCNARRCACARACTCQASRQGRASSCKRNCGGPAVPRRGERHGLWPQCLAGGYRRRLDGFGRSRRHVGALHARRAASPGGAFGAHVRGRQPNLAGVLARADELTRCRAHVEHAEPGIRLALRSSAARARRRHVALEQFALD